MYQPVEDKTARTLEKHREVINDENSDTDYQTSLEDQDDFRSIQTRHEQLPTQTTTSRSDFDIVEREQTPPSHVTTEVSQAVKQHSANGDTEYLARQFGELQQAFSSMLHRSEKDADKGIRNLSRKVTVDTSGKNSHVITSSRNERHLQINYNRNEDCNTVTTYAQVHQPSTSTSSSTSKRSRRLKSSVVVPCHSTLYDPEKEKLTSHREPAMESTRRAQSKSPQSRHQTQRRARFNVSNDDRNSASKRHDNSSDDESSTESTDDEKCHTTGKHHKSKEKSAQRQDKSVINAEQHSTTRKNQA